MLMLLHFGNKLVDLVKDGLVAGDTSLVSAGEDVLVVVFELFPADCTYYMVRTWFRLFKTHWLFFVRQ
jgi:hypothetical protein